MKFSLATLYVKDMQASLDFYNGLLGIPVLSQMETPGGTFAFLGEEGGVQLELIAAPEHADVGHSGFSVGFTVEDLAAASEALKQAGFPVERQFSPGPGTTLAFLKGPSGEEVELVHHA